MHVWHLSSFISKAVHEIVEKPFYFCTLQIYTVEFRTQWKTVVLVHLEQSQYSRSSHVVTLGSGEKLSYPNSFHWNNVGIFSLGTIHLRRWQIFRILDPYPPTAGSFYYYPLANLANFFTLPPKKCRDGPLCRLANMVTRDGNFSRPSGMGGYRSYSGC